MARTDANWILALPWNITGVPQVKLTGNQCLRQAAASFQTSVCPKSPDTNSLPMKMGQDSPRVGLLSPYRLLLPGACSEQGEPTSQETLYLLHMSPLPF